MRTTIVAASSGTASLIAGIIAPMVIPPTLPEWVRYALLGLAVVLYLIAFAAWLTGRGRHTADRLGQSIVGDGNNQAGRDVIIHADAVEVAKQIRLQGLQHQLQSHEMAEAMLARVQAEDRERDLQRAKFRRIIEGKEI